MMKHCLSIAIVFLVSQGFSAEPIPLPEASSNTTVVPTVAIGQTSVTTSEASKPLYKIGGEVRIRPEFHENNITSASTKLNRFVGSRTRLNITLMPIDSLEAFIQPQFTRVWGEVVPGIAADGTITPSQIGSGGTVDPYLSVHQAFVSWKFIDNASLQLGRQELAYGDHIVIGNLGYSNVGRSFDAARILLFEKDLGVDAFYAQLANEEVSGSGLLGAEDFAGLYAYSKEHFGLKQADLYGLWLYDDRAGGTATFRVATIGSRLLANFAGLDARVEGNAQVGKHLDATMVAYMVDAELGKTFSFHGNNTVSLGYNRASGDGSNGGNFTRYHQLFPTAHRWLGLMDLFGRQNIQSAVLHLGWDSGKHWRAITDVHSFWKVEANDLLYSVVSEKPLPGQAALTSNSKHAGEEWDMVLGYKFNNNVTFEGLGGLFFPGKYFSPKGTGYFSYLQTTFSL